MYLPLNPKLNNKFNIRINWECATLNQEAFENQVKLIYTYLCT